jgi:PBP1b-binding outer membrane lipoprotein LpoB
MRKLVLSLAVISAMVFASCSNQSNTTETTSDSTNIVVDSFEMSLDSMDIIPMEYPIDSITTDSIN